ncbi:hypothetical protein JCM10207_000847 [Rhodosporidiobolus poonsookiae]
MSSAVDRSGIAPLLALRDELNAAIDQLVASNEPLVSLDSLTLPTPGTPAKLNVASVASKINSLVLGGGGVLERAMGVSLPSSCAPLARLHSVDLFHCQYHAVAALRVVVEAHVTETLKEAASDGKEALHVDEIAKSSNIDPKKLGRILRLLASYHIFREVDLDVFANNRNSLFLDTGKAVDELKATDDFYSGSNGLAACITHCADDVMKGAAYLAEVVLDAETAASYSPAKSSLSRAFHVDGPFWEYFAQPGNERYTSRFASAMKGTSIMHGEDGILNGFPSKSLDAGATIVDVGSGFGAVSRKVAEAFPNLKLTLQDRPEVMQGPAQELWQSEMPDALESGRVMLMPHDFYQPQPVKGANMYLMRYIIHDLCDEDALKVLSNLAAAAAPSSRLLLIEQTYDALAAGHRAPTSFPYLMDMQMLIALNAQERTEKQYKDLGDGAGWELVKVWRTGPDGVDGPVRHFEFKLAKA